MDKKAPESGTIHPQPTGDPLDPLNWSRLQKHIILGIVMLKCFLFTYLTTTTVPSFPEIQAQYDINYAQVNWTVAIPSLGLTIGPLIWSPLCEIYGRRTVFIVGTVMALVSTAGAAVADGYGGYMAARFFQGLGVSPGSTVGMAVVNDLFFNYERGQKLGLWVLAIDSGLLLGPTFGGLFDLISAEWINWFNALLFAVLFLLELFFMPETLYPRNQMLQVIPGPILPMPETVSTVEASVKDPEKAPHIAESSSQPPPAKMPLELENIPRTKALPFLNFRPIPSIKHPRPWSSLKNLVLTFQQPPVVIAILGYSFLWYWWVVAVITMVPSAYEEYSALIQGLLVLGLFVGTIVAEVGFSGWLSDWIVGWLAKRRGGVRVAEMRLWLGYPAVWITGVGLILWGVSIDKNYHWMVGQVAFFLFAAGIQIGNTVLASYVVDCYPLQSTSMITFYSVFLNLSAFINPFFIAEWQESSGWTWTFTAAGIITIVGCTLTLALLHRFGARMRAWAPVPSWVNPEFD